MKLRNLIPTFLLIACSESTINSDINNSVIGNWKEVAKYKTEYDADGITKGTEHQTAKFLSGKYDVMKLTANKITREAYMNDSLTDGPEVNNCEVLENSFVVKTSDKDVEYKFSFNGDTLVTYDTYTFESGAKQEDYQKWVILYK